MTPVRQLGPTDAATYRTIRLAALRTDPDSFGARHDDEAAQPPEAFAARLASSAVFTACQDGTAVAMAAFKRHDGASERHKAFVWGVFVQPAHRGHGLAHALMSILLATADAIVDQVTLTVAAGNPPALALYERLGFATYGTEPRAFRTSLGWRDSILMVRFGPLSRHERPG